MRDKLRSTLKVCLILILLFSAFPEVVFSYEDTYKEVEINLTPEGKNHCNEHHCPILPTKPFHHCAVCCVFSHSFLSLSSVIVFHCNDTPQPSSTTEDVFYKELFAKTIFHPPQSIL